jgi:hypothetical protein
MEDKRVELSLHAVTKPQTAQTCKKPTPGRDGGGNPERPTSRVDKNLRDKELKDKE